MDGLADRQYRDAQTLGKTQATMGEPTDNINSVMQKRLLIRCYYPQNTGNLVFLSLRCVASRQPHDTAGDTRASSRQTAFYVILKQKRQ